MMLIHRKVLYKLGYEIVSTEAILGVFRDLHFRRTEICSLYKIGLEMVVYRKPGPSKTECTTFSAKWIKSPHPDLLFDGNKITEVFNHTH